VRRFWRGEHGREGELAAALAGSPGLFAPVRSRPVSVDFVTCHDGFTLADLVSYEHKHNQANLEDNRDGSHGNHSRNWGVEGPTGNPAIRALRARARRSLMASLALTAGVPMLSHGDELGRTQQGNNNAYCHDSPLTWLDWELDEDRAALLKFTRELFQLRREKGLGAGAEIVWLAPTGAPLPTFDSRSAARGALGVWISGTGGELLAAINGGEHEVLFQLPRLPPGTRWQRRLSTAEPQASARLRWRSLRLMPHSLVLLDQDDRGSSSGGPSSANS
jgi:glycogen operon protein